MAEKQFYYSLSNPQSRMWYSMSLHEVNKKKGDNAYVVPFLVRLRGSLKHDALKMAVHSVAGRHEMLRARFDVVDGEITQWFAPISENLFTIEYVEGRTPEKTAEALAIAEGCRPMDLAHEAPFRVVLYQISEHDHLLLLALHHLVTDGMSMNILFDDLGRHYGDFVGGIDAPLKPAPRYIDSMNSVSERHDSCVSYWQEVLRGASFGIDWPSMGRSSAEPEIAFAEATLPSQLVASLREVASATNVSLFVVLLAGYRLLLQLYTEQSDMIIGVPCAGRQRTDGPQPIGLFVNTLPVRLAIETAETVEAFFRNVSETLTTAREHDELPIDAILRALGPVARGNSKPPIGAIFNYRSFSAPALAACGFAVDIRRHPLPPPDTEFTGLVEKIGDKLYCRFDYRTDRFGDRDAARLIENYQTILENMVANREQTVERILQPGPKDLALQDKWGKGQVMALELDSVVDIVRAAFVRHADRIAIIHDRQLTYAELADAVRSAATMLRHHGVDKGVRVALCANRSVDLIIAILAILEAGGTYVPLSTDWPERRLHDVIEDLNPELLLVDSEMPAICTQQLPLSQLTISSDINSSAMASPEGAEIAYILFTSGSTGRPKGVAVRHDSLANQVAWFNRTFAVGVGRTMLARTPMSFDASIWEVFCPLAAGATLVLANEEESWNPIKLNRLLQQHPITDLQCVPSLLSSLLDGGAFRNTPKPWRIFCGGEALSPSLVDRTKAATGAKVINLYGPTETTVQITWHEPDQGDREVPVGQPIDNVILTIRSPKGRRLPTGVVGEIWASGLPVAKGYIGMGDQGGFQNDPWDSSIRTYRTGDYGRWRDDGQLVLSGRIDSQIKIRGQRFELKEIEAALRSLPEVHDVALLFIEESKGYTLSAFVTERIGCSIDVSSIRSALRSLLPAAAVPKRIISIGALPLLPNGKLDRDHLRSLIPDADCLSAPSEHDIADLVASLKNFSSDSA
jgi:amino acid adenylation domain-containing protein